MKLEDYANWIVKNKDKANSPEFLKVANAYQALRQAKEQQGITDSEQLSDRAVRVSAQTEADRKRYDPTIGMSPGQLAAAGSGSYMTDMSLGAQQLVRPNSPELSQEYREKRQLDRPLEQTTAGSLGKAGTAMIPAALTAAVPGLNTYTGAAATGAGLGLLSPTEDGASGKLRNAATGMTAGLAGQGVANTIGRAVRPVQSSLNPEQQRLAQLAIKEGLPLDAAAQTGSKPLQAINSVMGNLPLTAGTEAAKQEALKNAFNQAVLKRTGINGISATPEILASQKKSLGTVFEDVASRNSIDFNKGALTTKLADIAKEAERRLAQPGPIVNTVDDILADAAKTGSMPGLKYQGWRSTLNGMAGNDTQGKLAADIKRALNEAFDAQVSGADSEAWKKASREYANLKTVSKAMGGAGNEAASGNIPAAQLSQALRNSVSTEGKALGRGDLNDISRIGELFVKNQVPDSGTAQRQFWQSLLTGGGLGGGALMMGADPTTAAMVAGGSLAGPKLAQALLNRPGMQNYLANGVTNQNALALAEALKKAAPAAAITYAGQQ
jgi:hypothetical protein